MGVGYIIINETKKEQISFAHLNGNKKREIAGNPAQAAIVAWYLLNNQGDQVQFVSDTYEDWPFKTGSRDGLKTYPDKTDAIVSMLIEENILRDKGMLFVDQDEPEEVYIRDIVNIWCDS